MSCSSTASRRVSVVKRPGHLLDCNVSNIYKIETSMKIINFKEQSVVQQLQRVSIHFSGANFFNKAKGCGIRNTESGYGSSGQPVA